MYLLPANKDGFEDGLNHGFFKYLFKVLNYGLFG